MIYILYKLILDDNNYILSYSLVFNKKNTSNDVICNHIPNFSSLEEMNCYQYIDNLFMFDENKYKNIQLHEIENLKKSILSSISNICTQTIYKGIDIEGLGHFSLTEKDQINISSLYTKVLSGITEVPYHADGQLCMMYTAEQMISIALAAEACVTYNTTLCNHINVWINRCTTIEELNKIEYDEKSLPKDLQESFNNIINSSVVQSINLMR